MRINAIAMNLREISFFSFNTATWNIPWPQEGKSYYYCNSKCQRNYDGWIKDLFHLLCLIILTLSISEAVQRRRWRGAGQIRATPSLTDKFDNKVAAPRSRPLTCSPPPAHFNGGCRRNFANSQLYFHQAQVCLRACSSSRRMAHDVRRQSSLVFKDYSASKTNSSLNTNQAIWIFRFVAEGGERPNWRGAKPPPHKLRVKRQRDKKVAVSPSRPMTCSTAAWVKVTIL